MTRKREVTLKNPDVHNNKGNLFKDKAKAVMDNSTGQQHHPITEVLGGSGDVAVKKWLADIIKTNFKEHLFYLYILINQYVFIEKL